ncbi:MAG: ATP-binding cassette domain-containing protein [Cyclobacteriaceae bacterium]|jgi:molybdate transport system ATP-binding protein|nr:ATP-binding cassette domain-containing protein [Cyclobacteriaceae bacterium]
MISLNDIYFSVQGTVIFKQLNLQFESGVSYLITGNNGIGKTTLLNLIAGKIQPKSGSISYDFIDSSLTWDEKYELRKKHIHYVPTHALHELMSGPDLYYQQRYYTIEDTTPVPTVKDFFGVRYNKLHEFDFPASFNIDHLLKLELPRLSNGQFKKIIILKQLLDNLPKILLLDYPFEGLDLTSRIELKEFLDHLANNHHIQLIIADHNHPQLPNAITKKIELTSPSCKITNRTQSELDSTSLPQTIVPVKETEPVVEMRNLKIQYGNTIIIKNLNWKINRGERWALTGPNGSGKTTLFSLIYADHPMAYSEQVYLFGKRRGTGESIWDIKKRISYLGPEQIHFLDAATSLLTVYQYLNIKNEVTGVKSIIDFFRIEHLLQKRVRQLSNGELQLVLLIGLFLSQKELLLLDEPFQFLDPTRKARVNEYLSAYLDEDTTLVLITHYEGDVTHWTNHRMKL